MSSVLRGTASTARRGEYVLTVKSRPKLATNSSFGRAHSTLWVGRRRMMGKIITTAEAIPPAPYYVLSDDSFMSDWGQAEGRVNTIIFPCSDQAEADIVATNARNRDEQRNVRIIDRKPALSSGVVYSLLTKEEASRWYEPGSFAPEPTDQPYNGWSNYKTWATDTWLTDDQDSCEAARASVASGGGAGPHRSLRHP